MREVRTITSILCSSPRLTAEQVHYHGVIWSCASGPRVLCNVVINYSCENMVMVICSNGTPPLRQSDMGHYFITVKKSVHNSFSAPATSSNDWAIAVFTYC
jgi:hypothetical protein